MRNHVDELNKALEDIKTMITKAISEPDTVGWLRLIVLLKEAAKDKEISASMEASAFIELSLKLIRNSSLGSTADDVIQPLASKFISANASAIASKRFDPHKSAEAWIVNEWNENKDSAKYKRNKSAFARDYVARVEKEFGITVRERTITSIWLNKK